MLSTLLNEMDGVESASDVLVVGATNRLDMIDAALLRPGRFDHVIEVPTPDSSARVQILRIHTRCTPLHEDVSLDVIAERTQGFSGAELENVCREAVLLSLRENLSACCVHMRHFELVLHKPLTPPPQLTTLPVGNTTPFAVSLTNAFTFI